MRARRRGLSVAGRVHLTDYKVRILDGATATGRVTRVLIDATNGERTGPPSASAPTSSRRRGGRSRRASSTACFTRRSESLMGDLGGDGADRAGWSPRRGTRLRPRDQGEGGGGADTHARLDGARRPSSCSAGSSMNRPVADGRCSRSPAAPCTPSSRASASSVPVRSWSEAPTRTSRPDDGGVVVLRRDGGYRGRHRGVRGSRAP